MLRKFRNHVMANKFGMDIVLLLAVIFSSYSDVEAVTPVKKLLIDTDVGGDDSFALIMALEAERLDNGPKIIGITCVNGNTDVDQIALNVLKTLKVVDRLDIPVYEGAAHPLVLPNRKDYYFGRDGFGDFDYPDPPSKELIQSKHAVNAMIDLVKAHPNEVTLVALGPLTNVALAIRMYPPFLTKLQQLIVMGGSTEGRAIARLGVEFNFAVDPVANYVVFNSSTFNPVILVPWETSMRTTVTREFRNSLNQSNNRKLWLVNAGENITLYSEEKYWHCPDATTMSIALTSGSIVTKSETYYSEAIYDGTVTPGMIIVDYTNVTRKAANTNIIQDIDLEVYKQLIVRYFTSPDDIV